MSQVGATGVATPDDEARLEAKALSEQCDSDGPDDSDVQDRVTDAAEVVSGRVRRSVSIGLGSLVTGSLIIGLVAAVVTMSWLYAEARRQLDVQATMLDNNAHAERAALDYAVDAAEMNFQDLDGWKSKLVSGTSPELEEKLTAAATSMEQILVPLQWTSVARPLAAQVHSENGGIYVVDAFVSVVTKTSQAPDGLQSTATYSVTLDSTNNWQITDVGGVGPDVGRK